MTAVHQAITYRLLFHHAFGLNHGSRDGTDTVYVKISSNGYTGYGEAALPPYLGYKVGDVARSIETIPAAWFEFTDLDTALKSLQDMPLVTPAKTAIDIALHDLYARQKGISVATLLQAPHELRPCMYTLGTSSPSMLVKKLEEAIPFRLYKLKLDGQHDRERISAFRQCTTAAFCADANQAWKNIQQASEEIQWLKDQGCLFVEQPLPVDHPGSAELKRKSVLPVYLDESIQSLTDITKMKDACDGINIKLVKCGGLSPALSWIKKARAYDLKIILGCMSESSCGAGAASQLMGYADFIDLDGPLLISNDPFTGVNYANDQLIPYEMPGHGAVPLALLKWS